MPSARVELDRAGVRKLLTSSEVQSMLDEKAQSVADAARSQGLTVGWDNATPLPIVVESAGSSSRARALIVADSEAGLAMEAKHRVLVSSLGAAR